METSTHLSVILDLSPSQWHLSSTEVSKQQTTLLSLADFLPQLFIFLNAHLVSQLENTLNVFGAFPGKSAVLYSSNETVKPIDAGATIYQPFATVDSAIIQRIKAELGSMPEEGDAPVALVGALTKALCYINRLVNPSSAASIPASSTATPRILIISVSPDLSASYIPIMNSIFCAQKLKVILDVCKLYGPDTVFLQQAAHLTGGSYISIQRRDSVLQYLMTAFLSPPSIRRLMAVPTENRIDFRAACFCHKTIVDIGFICSVCLSIFCKPTPVCSTCRAKFSMKTLQKLKESLKPSLPPNIPDPEPVIDSAPSSPAPPLPPLPGSFPFNPSMMPPNANLPPGLGLHGLPPLHNLPPYTMPLSSGKKNQRPTMSMPSGLGMPPGMPMPPGAMHVPPGMAVPPHGVVPPMGWNANGAGHPPTNQ